jgi:hypothetical protein
MNMETITREYAHIPLDEEVTAIGGYYILEKEVRLPFRGEEVLYVIGMSLIDSSCCGVAGCKYAIVPGYILEWQHRTNDDNLPITQVQPIRDKETRAEITTLIKQADIVQHVEFN